MPAAANRLDAVSAHGRCQAQFAAVRAAFEGNLVSGADIGASVAVAIDGQLVVDLWGGHLDLERTRPWREDTITPVFSTTKTMTALCALVLADRGDLDFDAPIARYWPEFAANGKARVLVRHVLGHTAGLPGWTEPIGANDLYDWDKATTLLARQSPWWEPGTASAYHAVTQGFLLGEVVRRITGRSLGTFFAREIAGPLGGDFHIGLDPRHDSRFAPIIAAGEPAAAMDPTTVFARIALNPKPDPQAANDPAWRRAEIPAGNGIANARAVAVIQSVLACGGESGGRRLLRREGAEAVFRQQCDGVDLAFLTPIRWGLGLALEINGLAYGPRAVFWGGSGGSLVVVDFARRMTIAYVMNRALGAPFGDARNVALTKAVYEAVAA